MTENKKIFRLRRRSAGQGECFDVCDCATCKHWHFTHVLGQVGNISVTISFLHTSRGTKVDKMLTLAPERYTAEFFMVAKVILWCIWNHCIADSIDLHNARAVNFLRKPIKNLSKYYFSKRYVFLSKKFRIEKYWVYIIIQHRRRPQKQWWSSKNTAYWFLKRVD